ncbi:MAG: hypothetical protein RL329_1102 [Bacteroidota bacterium]|jgi:restriction endonuclease S subunit
MFLVQRGELEGRLDCYGNYAKKFNSINSIYPSQKLSSLVKTFSGGTPDKSKPNYWNGDIHWVSPKDFGELEIFTSEDMITEAGLKNSATKLIPKGNILMVVRSGILQHTLPVSINTKDVTINQDIKALIIQDNKVTPYYLAHFLRTFQDKILSCVVKHSTTVQSVNTKEFENLQIPIPPLDIQQQIVHQMQAAYAEKRQKEAQTAQLLASIDGYLLEKLGITLPQAVEKKKTFVVWSDRVSGGRFDPKLYLPSSKNLLDCLCTSKYESTLLKNIVNQSVSGDWGVEDVQEGYSKCLVIRATEFDNRYNLKLENSRVKYRYILNEKLDKLDVQANDLLIEKSGGSTDQPVGRIALITKDILNENVIGFSNFVHKIRLSSAVHPEFVYYFLKTIHNIKVTDLMQSQTNGIRNLIMREYLNIPIPIPPINIQTEIVTHISTLRAQAQQLETEAKTALTIAKAAVEKQILGL